MTENKIPSSMKFDCEQLNASKECSPRPVQPQDDFVRQLKEIGTRKYHDKHPFHLRLHSGELSSEEVRIWIRNRFYYQAQIPIKDAIVLSKLACRDDRRIWIQRIKDHDGNSETEPGGIEAWLWLGEAAGISRSEMLDTDGILPGVRFSVDAYVNFCRNSSWLEAVASSLTEMFSPTLISDRMVAMREHYPWIAESGLKYFSNRLTQAPADCDHALRLVLANAKTAEQQEKVRKSLSFKCDVLWSLLDAIEQHCYRQSANAPLVSRLE